VSLCAPTRKSANDRAEPDQESHPAMSEDIRHPIFARLYARISESAEKRGAADHRARLLSGLSGRVIELGAGNGKNFPHYPSTVTEVIAVEPEPHLRELAQREAARVASLSCCKSATAQVPGDGQSMRRSPPRGSSGLFLRISCA